MPKASRRLLSAVGEAGADTERKSESEAANLKPQTSKINVFTGIIEAMARVEAITHHQDNIDITLSSPITHELSVAQSLAHNGVCLTLTAVNGDQYTVTAMRETLLRSNRAIRLAVEDVRSFDFRIEHRALHARQRPI